MLRQFLTFTFLTILTTFYGFNAKFSTPVTDDMLNEDATISAIRAPLTAITISATISFATSARRRP